MKAKLSLFIFLFISFSVYSQTEAERKIIVANTNVEVLNKMAVEFDSLYKKEKKEALEEAKKMGWQPTITYPNGGFAELMRLDENRRPIYYKTDNVGAALTTRANRLNSGGSLGLHLDGQNMTIAIWDGGKVRNTHELLTGRVTQVDNASVFSDHATHVSGTMIGNATASPASKGMASQANLRAYDWSGDVSEITLAAANGLLISNHSYGASPANVTLGDWGKYNFEAKSFDNIMFNAPYYLFVNSAGNSRGGGYNPDKNGYDLLYGKSVSKNSMVVGAVFQVSNYVDASSVSMSDFSSWGPTDDGRIKPDICGKGVNTRSSTAASDSSYDIYSGTSMSSPNVAGTLLLLQQHYNNVKGNFMRSSTLRGLALHTADEAGAYPGPDYAYGWGLLNAEKAANLITQEGTQSIIQELILNQGDSYTFSVESSGLAPLVGSICWTDPAALATSGFIFDNPIPKLVNDLDIRISKAATTFYPWKLDINDIEAPATTGDNIVDNIEKIEVPNASGNYIVTITNKRTLTNNLQKYSLIISGINTHKLLLSSNQTIIKRICNGIDALDYNLNLSTQPAFSGTATLSVSGLPTGATYSFSANNLTVSAPTTLSLANLASATPGTYTVVVRAQSGSFFDELPLTLIIEALPTQVPLLTFPSNNQTGLDVTQTLTWNSMGDNISSYTLEIARDSGFTTDFQTFTTSTNSQLISNLYFGSDYFWRVKAANSCGNSSYSNVFSFSTLCSNSILITTTEIQTNAIATTWTNPNGASSFLVQIVPHGTMPSTNYTTVATNSYTFTGLNSNTVYDIYVKSSCSENTYSNAVFVPIPTKINYCSDLVFYDTGGPTGNYSNLEYYTTTITPTNPLNAVSVTFSSFSLEDQSDRLYIYNGPDKTYPFIGQQYGFTGTNNPGTIISTDVSGALTFVFYSDAVNTFPGWNATVNCNNVNLETANFNTTDFRYYPNPAQSTVNFYSKENINSIEVYSVLGQLILNEKYNATNPILNISSLTNGNYIVKVISDNAIQNIKIIKN